MKRIMIVMGTRPEAIKLCPLVLELKKRGRFEVLICSVKQHDAMQKSVLDAFSFNADFTLEIPREEDGVGNLTSQILLQTSRLFCTTKPDLVLVQGDTATAFAAALAAFYQKIPVGHIEAGLRTYRTDSPFPEELHREAITLLADYHFAPTLASKRNLLREGRAESSVYLTGNTVVDALRLSLSGALGNPPWQLPEGKRLLLFTAHRRENLGKPLQGMFCALRRVVEETPDLIAICPLHPNPQVRETAYKILSGVRGIRMIEPPGFVSFHRLLAKSDLVMTDSGGIQEEAVSLGIPTVVMRYSSERTEGMRAGVLKLVGSDENGIYEVVKRLLEPNSPEYAAMKKPSGVFGDGRASVRIADVLEKIS